MISSTLDRQAIESMVRQVLKDKWTEAAQAGQPAVGTQNRPTSHNGGPNPLRVNVSARHMHVNQKDMETLFGPGAQLSKLKDLYQDGEYASEQLVNVVGPRNWMIPGVRILGPMRDYTQVELSYTDGVFLGIDLPLRISGNHENTPGCVLVGPHGAIALTQGVIRAERHVHMHPDDLAHFGVEDGAYMKLNIQGPCGLTFDRVKVRMHPRVKLEIHIVTDEGNACNLSSATRMELLK